MANGERINGYNGVFIQREAKLLREVFAKRQIPKEKQIEFIAQHGEGMRRYTEIIFSREERSSTQQS